MIAPKLPLNESSRLKSLRQTSALDTPAEERFDRLTRLARRMFNVPIALVSLIDENRQWFKSCFGLSVNETPREISFCGHAIMDNSILLVPDASRDERFRQNPLVTADPFIRFYAGCPLRHIDGSLLGTLCIIDTKPRILDDADLEALQDLGELAEHELMAVQLATLDDLTKISNRRGFISLAKKSLEIHARENIPAALVFIDLDKFKEINDKFGHAEGDQALIRFASIMKDVFRKADVFARMGGDEFAALLTNTSIEPAEEVIQRLQDAVSNHNSQSNCGYKINFTAGIVVIDYQNDYSIDSLLHKADSVMYREKTA